jgi:glycosyltransferase involved in cell wall biosynthesis
VGEPEAAKKGKQLRVLHVVPTYLPALRYGGPIFSVHGLCRGTVERGHEVHVFTTNVDGPGVSDVPLERAVNLDGVNVWYFPTGLGRRLYRSPTLSAALRDRIASFDLVHLHSVFLWPTLAAARIAANRRVPYVLSPRGMLVPELIRQMGRFRKTAWIELFERRTIREAAALHVTAVNEAEDLKPFNFVLPPVWVIANGVHLPPPTENYCAVSADVRSAVAGGEFILTLGRINWKKNLLTLIDAVAALPNQRLIIAGNSEDDYARDVRRRINELGITNRIILIDRQIEEPDKSYLYRSCNIFLLPSLHENFGNVALEAMVHRKPVVVSSSAGVSEIVTEAKAGIVVPPQKNAIADAISLLMASPERRISCGQSGRRIAEERFGWSQTADQMIEHYGTIIRQRLPS